MPSTALQPGVPRAIAANRSVVSGIAVGAARNAGGLRVSNGNVIVAADESNLSAFAAADGASLHAAGATIDGPSTEPATGRPSHGVGASPTRLEWSQESACRLFPTQANADLGLVLHPSGPATNRRLVATSRRGVRHALDRRGVSET